MSLKFGACCLATAERTGRNGFNTIGTHIQFKSRLALAASTCAIYLWSQRTSASQAPIPEADKKWIPYFSMQVKLGDGIVVVTVDVAVVETVDVAVVVGDDVNDVVGVVIWHVRNPPCIQVSVIALRSAAVLPHSVASNGMFWNAHPMSPTGSSWCSGPRNSCTMLFRDDTTPAQFWALDDKIGMPMRSTLQLKVPELDEHADMI